MTVVVVGLACLAATTVMSVVSSVVASVAALLSTLMWTLAGLGGLGVLGATAVYVVREVLAYRADQRDAERVRLLLAARMVPIQSAESAPPVPVGPALGRVRRLPLSTAGGGA